MGDNLIRRPLLPCSNDFVVFSVHPRECCNSTLSRKTLLLPQTYFVDEVCHSTVVTDVDKSVSFSVQVLNVAVHRETLELTDMPRKLKLSSQDGPLSKCCMYVMRNTKNELHQASA